MNNGSATSALLGNILSLGQSAAPAAPHKRDNVSFNETFTGVGREIAKARAPVNPASRSVREDHASVRRADNRIAADRPALSAQRSSAAEHASRNSREGVDNRGNASAANRQQSASDSQKAQNSGATEKSAPRSELAQAMAAPLDTLVPELPATAEPTPLTVEQLPDTVTGILTGTSAHELPTVNESEEAGTDSLADPVALFTFAGATDPIAESRPNNSDKALPSGVAGIGLALTDEGSGNGNGLGNSAGNPAKSGLAAPTTTDTELLQPGMANLAEKGGFAKTLAALSETKIGNAGQNPGAAPTPALEAIARAADPLAPAGRGFVVQTAVAPTVGHPQWSQAVGDRVLWLAAQNISSAEIRLDPPELGPMQVRVTVHQDQVQVTFTSPHQGVREALDQGAARLREMFNEQGLTLNVDVSDQSFARRGDEESARGQGKGDAAGAEDETVAAETAVVNVRLIDHYA